MFVKEGFETYNLLWCH